MRLADFHFELPDQLIARYPEPERSKSRLLVLNGASGELDHHHFYDLPDLVEPGDLLVFNNTRVIPARLFGHKESGGKVEILIERLVDSRQALAYVRASRSPKPGTRLVLENGAACEVIGRDDDLFRLQLAEGDWLPVLDAIGHMPLPPYIDRADELGDRERYQTVYGERAGAVAAPTAGLHFDEPLLAKLEQKGIDSCFVTLHVGAGTFSPVRVDDISEHTMHSEIFEVSEEVCAKVRATRARGGRVIAVGTTSVRCLESASRNGAIEPARGETDIFIYPGYRFRSVDALITNFHLPESTLILLVSAFAGREHILAAYRTAIEESYRFFSYGDAMFINCANLSVPDAEGRSS